MQKQPMSSLFLSRALKVDSLLKQIQIHLQDYVKFETEPKNCFRPRIYKPKKSSLNASVVFGLQQGLCREIWVCCICPATHLLYVLIGVNFPYLSIIFDGKETWAYRLGAVNVLLRLPSA